MTWRPNPYKVQILALRRWKKCGSTQRRKTVPRFIVQNVWQPLPMRSWGITGKIPVPCTSQPIPADPINLSQLSSHGRNSHDQHIFTTRSSEPFLCSTTVWDYEACLYLASCLGAQPYLILQSAKRGRLKVHEKRVWEMGCLLPIHCHVVFPTIPLSFLIGYLFCGWDLKWQMKFTWCPTLLLLLFYILLPQVH